MGRRCSDLDTHILIHAVSGNLRPAEQRLLARNRWSISSIVLWELAQAGSAPDESTSTWMTGTSCWVLSRLHRWPIDLQVALASTRLDSAAIRPMNHCRHEPGA